MTQTVAQSLSVNGIELAWSDRGSGAAGTPPLVLVHGFTGSSHDFALVADDLAVDRRVVLLDQRGHGHATKTGGLEGYTIDQLVSDLAAFLDALGDGPVDLLGHSMGGRVAMGLVLSRPDLVSTLVLMDTSAWSFLPPDDSIRQLVKAWIESFDPAKGMPESMSLGSPEDLLIEERMPVSWQKEKNTTFAGMDAYAVKAFGMALMADVAEGEASLRAELPSITCPTTVIAGEHDHPLVDQAPELADLVANGRLAVIEGAYHSPQLTHPEDWKNAVRAHLAWADTWRPRP
ncbi:MAG TPA: alpha/beta hydrolase [Acidimicrobiales bacterium]